MERGTLKEFPATSAIEDVNFVHSLYSVGLWEEEEKPEFACSPDMIALIDLS